MGREIKRVALDFNWPLENVWSGYVNPHYKECSACDGSGSTKAAQRLNDIVSLLMLSGSDAQRGKNHPYFTYGNFPRSGGEACPSPDMAELTTALADRPPSFMGHDCCDQFSAQKKIIAAAGLPEKWGWCTACNGDGIDAEKREEYEAWTKTEPPAGDGWQLWETVSEGSPISPVFATREGLCGWLVKLGHSPESAEAFTKAGWAPSAVMSDGKILSGIDAFGETSRECTNGQRDERYK